MIGFARGKTIDITYKKVKINKRKNLSLRRRIMSKRMWAVLLVISTMCIALTGCKKHVGTSEDNANIDEEENTETDAATDESESAAE